MEVNYVLTFFDNSNDYAKLLASRVHEEKAKRSELRKRRASSLRK
jgi:small subunit ribosomal protein S6e